jgi:hypothetical protein
MPTPLADPTVYASASIIPKTKKESSSFLKKRTKKTLLSLAALKKEEGYFRASRLSFA